MISEVFFKNLETLKTASSAQDLCIVSSFIKDRLEQPIPILCAVQGTKSEVILVPFGFFDLSEKMSSLKLTSQATAAFEDLRAQLDSKKPLNLTKFEDGCVGIELENNNSFKFCPDNPYEYFVSP